MTEAFLERTFCRSILTFSKGFKQKLITYDLLNKSEKKIYSISLTKEPTGSESLNKITHKMADLQHANLNFS